MPSVAQRTRKSVSTLSPQSQKLRPATPEDIHAWSDHDSDSTQSEPLPEDLDESWPFTFQAGDAVWVRTAGGNWLRGRVSGEITRKGLTREKEGLFYPVKFDIKLRKYFAPLNGEIKPDTPHTRRLLKAAGYEDI
ncbi:hypothetical protein Moror_508 [Moniliophthora roreri MCA 2997]|uniref:Uncharacterized protein n=1 Tax=Moniliophthora roreri (strain MCA 2997) TaxID=1381753 RepID=V2WTC3_MONRO|nr:hypothetical protein Moror_508 [Moniliophthora roreri MCA 2997]